MIKYVRELEEAFRPLDKTYTMLGLYSGFRADYVLEGKPKKAFATLGLMPRESLWYYPISMLTLKHDRMYLVFYLSNKNIPKLHLLQPKVLKYKGIDVDVGELKRISLGNKEFLYYSENEKVLRKAMRIAEKGDVLHVALTPSTGVLYVFLRPEPGKVREVASEALRLAKELESRALERV